MADTFSGRQRWVRLPRIEQALVGSYLLICSCSAESFIKLSLVLPTIAQLSVAELIYFGK